MGSGISLSNENLIKQEVLRQKQLPLDCSDINDLMKAKEEIMKIRRICQSIESSSSSNSNNNTSTSIEEKITLALIHEVKNKITERFDNLQDAFLAIDVDRDGFISQQEFKDVRIFIFSYYYSLNVILNIGMLEMGFTC